MYVSYSIWDILYRQSPNAFGVDLQQMTTYGVLGILLGSVLGVANRAQRYIATQVRAGSLEIDLMKPLDFMLHMLGRNIGELCVQLLTSGLPGLLFAYLFLGLRLPANPRLGFAFLLSLALGYLVFFGINFLLGMLAIVTHDIRSYGWLYGSLIRFTAGQMIPLWLFPPLLGAIVAALPFQAIYFTPISIYIGAYPGSLGWVLLKQLLWAGGVLLFCRFVWRHAQRRITVQGG
jgi:ABC-2 type transport system permease protein